MSRRLRLQKLARETEKEGKRLAVRVCRGELSRAEIEQGRRDYPNDAEPAIALFWLDRWGIR